MRHYSNYCRASVILFVLGLLTPSLSCNGQTAPDSSAITFVIDELRNVFKERDKTETQWGLPISGFDLGILTSKDEFILGEGVYSLITLTNASERKHWSVRERVDGTRTDIDLVLLTSNGAMVPPIRSPISNGPGNESARVIQINPGGVDEQGVRLERLFNLQTSGVYYVYARKRMPRDFDGKPFTLTSGTARFTILAKQGDTNNGAATPVTSIIPDASKVLPQAAALPDTTASSAVTAAVKRPNALLSGATSFSTAQDDTANPAGGNAATQPKPVLAQFSEPTQRKLFAFGILLLCSFALLAFILLRARSRAAGSNK